MPIPRSGAPGSPNSRGELGGYRLDHLPPIDPPGRAQLKLYRGGHMLYLDPHSRKAFSADAGAFYRAGE